MAMKHLAFLLLLIAGCADVRVADAEDHRVHEVGAAELEQDLYARYIKADDLSPKVVSYELHYAGIIHAGQTDVHLLQYSYVWEVLPGNERGNALLLVFDDKKSYLGRFRLYDMSAIITLRGTSVDVLFPDETATTFDFSSGIPHSDESFGFDFNPAGEHR